MTQAFDVLGQDGSPPPEVVWPESSSEGSGTVDGHRLLSHRLVQLSELETLRDLAMTPDGRAFVTIERPAVNVWGMTASIWPEFLFVPILIALVISLGRTWRRRRLIVGARHCRRCMYCLSGAESTRCPECGADLRRRRSSIIGRRTAPRAIIGVSLLLLIITMYSFGVLRTPRRGSFSHALPWRSLAVFKLAYERDWWWLYRWRVNVSTLHEFSIADGSIGPVLWRAGGRMESLAFDATGTRAIAQLDHPDTNRPRRALFWFDLASGDVVSVMELSVSHFLIGATRGGDTAWLLSAEAQTIETVACGRADEFTFIADINLDRMKLPDGAVFWEEPHVVSLPMRDRLLVSHRAPRRPGRRSGDRSVLRLLAPTHAAAPQETPTRRVDQLAARSDGSLIIVNSLNGVEAYTVTDDRIAPAGEVSPDIDASGLGSLVVHPERRWIVTGQSVMSRKGLELIDLDTGESSELPLEPAELVDEMMFAPDGRFLVLSSGLGVTNRLRVVSIER